MTTDQTTETTSAEDETTEQTDAPSTDNSTIGHDEDTGEDRHKAANREAQKLRKRARDAEQERDEARAAVTALQAQIIATSLTESRVTVEALTAAGHEPSSFFDTTENLNIDALTAAEKDTRRRFGIPGNTPMPDPSQGARSSDGPPRESAWERAFRDHG